MVFDVTWCRRSQDGRVWICAAILQALGVVHAVGKSVCRKQ